MQMEDQFINAWCSQEVAYDAGWAASTKLYKGAECPFNNGARDATHLSVLWVSERHDTPKLAAEGSSPLSRRSFKVRLAWHLIHTTITTTATTTARQLLQTIRNGTEVTTENRIKNVPGGPRALLIVLLLHHQNRVGYDAPRDFLVSTHVRLRLCAFSFTRPWCPTMSRSGP
jgi:hypothetical protein